MFACLSGKRCVEVKAYMIKFIPKGLQRRRTKFFQLHRFYHRNNEKNISIYLSIDQLILSHHTCFVLNKFYMENQSEDEKGFVNNRDDHTRIDSQFQHHHVFMQMLRLLYRLIVKMAFWSNVFGVSNRIGKLKKDKLSISIWKSHFGIQIQLWWYS